MAVHNEGHDVDRVRIEQFKKAFGDRPAELPIEDLRAWFPEREWATETYNRNSTVLSSLYRLAIENKKADSNPAKLLKRKQVPGGRVRFLNQHDADEEARHDSALAAFLKLQQQRGGQGPIFEHVKKGEMGKSLLGPRRWFEDAIGEAGIKDFTWHDLRQHLRQPVSHARCSSARRGRTAGPSNDSNDDALCTPCGHQRACRRAGT